MGNPYEPLEYISECEYWTLEKVGADNSTTDVTLSWDISSCDIPNDIQQIEIGGWDGLKWLSLGNSKFTGNKTEGGSITNKKEPPAYYAFAIASQNKPGYGPPIGLSFSNFGAKVSIADNATMYVNGNMLNDYRLKSNKNNERDTVSGLFINKGKILLKKDWTNNVKNLGFLNRTGQFYMVGNYQRIRGTYATRFSDLLAAGPGKKEMFADIHIANRLNLFDNQFSTTTYSLYIDNTMLDAIRRNTGFVSSNKGGYLVREIGDVGQDYLFPVGNTSLYRPIVISPKTDTGSYRFAVRLIPHDPSADTIPREIKAIDVQTVNKYFYHLIELRPKDNFSHQDAFDVAMYYNRSVDGPFQGIGHWDNNPESLPAPFKSRTDQNIWKKTYSLTYKRDTTLIRTPDMLKIKSWTDFSNPQFALIKAAFLINTNKFGNPYESGQGVYYTMEGDYFSNDEPLYPTEQAKDKAGQPVAPDFLEASHIMSIQGDAYSIPGKLEIHTDFSGNIQKLENSDYYKIYFINPDDGKKYLLARELYNVVNGSILVLNSEPVDETPCNANIKLSFSGDDPITLKLSNPYFKIEGIAATQIDSIVFRKQGDNAWVANIPGNQLANITGKKINTVITFPGLYKFELWLNVKTKSSTTKHKFAGQFIVEN